MCDFALVSRSGHEADVGMRGMSWVASYQYPEVVPYSMTRLYNCYIYSFPGESGRLIEH